MFFDFPADGGTSIGKYLFMFLIRHLLTGSTILELGSGRGTGLLSNFYYMWSVENDLNWLSEYNSHYIYAPLVNRWYDLSILKDKLPTEYDALLVDGPASSVGYRSLILPNLGLFNTDCLIIIDDVHRSDEFFLYQRLKNVLKRKGEVFPDEYRKSFGVIYYPDYPRT